MGKLKTGQIDSYSQFSFWYKVVCRDNNMTGNLSKEFLPKSVNKAALYAINSCIKEAIVAKWIWHWKQDQNVWSSISTAGHP